MLAAVTFAFPAAAEDAAAPSAPPPSNAAADAKAVTVDLVSTDPRATLERRSGTSEPSGLPVIDTSLGAVGRWETECVAPCSIRVDPRFSYRIAGDGLTPSRSFSLSRGVDRVRLSAEMGSSSARLTGLVLAGLGVGAAALGGGALIASPILESQDVGSKGFRSALLVGGVVALAAGVAGMGLGFFVWASNGSAVHADQGVLSAQSRGPVLTPSGLAF